MKPKLKLITCILIFLLFISIVNAADIYSESKEVEDYAKNRAKKLVEQGNRPAAKSLIKDIFDLTDDTVVEEKLKEILGETEVRGEGDKGTTDTDGGTKDQIGWKGGTGKTPTDGTNVHEKIEEARKIIDEVLNDLPALRKLKGIKKFDEIEKNFQKLQLAEFLLTEASYTATDIEIATISRLQTRINNLRTALEKLQTELDKDAIGGGGGFGGGGGGLKIGAVVIGALALFVAIMYMKAKAAKKVVREARKLFAEKRGETREDDDLDRLGDDSEKERDESGGRRS